MSRNAKLLVLVCLVLVPAFAFAQQTGSINGKVMGSDGLVIPGVTVEARSDALPGPRVTVTGGAGDYRLPALPPGAYTVTFVLSGMATVTKEIQVQLAQDTVANVTMAVEGVTENVTVTAQIVPVIEKDSTALKSAVSAEAIQAVPVGQEYRDLVKLIPGVMYTQDSIRGPSAGGSGQDNTYKFDGVNVTLPMYGTLSAEPASHDILQVTTVKGGAKAVDFDRSGGFSIDSVSKSGTSRYSGQVSYQLQNSNMSAAVKSPTASLSRYEQDRAWLTVNGGGPVLKNKLYFYGSYYRPTRTRNNAANLYGTLPSYESVRNEGFGKLTFTPTNSALVNVTYRQSHRLDKGDTFPSTYSATTGAGNEAWQKIFTADGSWVLNSRSFVSFKYTHFENPTQARPDYEAGVTVTTAVGTALDLNNLDTIGQFSVPVPVAGQTAYNAFVQPLIDRYGYTQAGVKTGGGAVGYYTEFNEQSFFRDAGQVAYNMTIGSTVQHDLHAGYQFSNESEELIRSSNGWGTVTVPGGRTSYQGTPIYYTATLILLPSGTKPTINTSYRSHNIEVNDTIKWKNVSFNVGVLASRDTLYGQGMKEDSSTVSGFVASTGTRYKMYQIPWSKMFQPRTGVTWAYNGRDTIYGSYARYVPAASSLPRAAAWDRSVINQQNRLHFDANGKLFGVEVVGSSSGKLFQQDMTPRTVDEFLIGTSKQVTASWAVKLYGRYRDSSHFWEDTENNSRLLYNPPAGIPRELYIANFAEQRAQLGSGSSYVIAELDGAYTKFYEATAESEWRGKKAFVRGSYTYSHYWGNFDQDNSTSGNDAAIFIGSSNIGDGGGRQLWDNKDGTLRGDRPHMLKLYGYYTLPWQASVGAYAIAQSGQPWESWSYEPYLAYIGTSTSDTNRYAEKAGSRRTPTHYQLDLNYTQSLRFAKRLNAQIALDLFNVFDKQTGYNYQPSVHSSTFGTPRSYFDPRRIQVAARLQF
jgi:hypothetical protein